MMLNVAQSRGALLTDLCTGVLMSEVKQVYVDL